MSDAFSTVRAAPASTARSSLDLIGLSYPFSQVGLLTASEFAAQAERRRGWGARGLPMGVHVLEALHRYGVLLPLFRVDLTSGAPERKQDITMSLTARHVHTTVITELLRGAAEGRAADPVLDGFEPWPIDRHRTLWPTYSSAYLYSRHQLLGLDMAAQFVKDLKPERQGNSTVVWHLDEADRPNAPTIEALRSWRSLAITLGALDTHYWPFITHTVSHDLATWRKARQEYDPAAMLNWLDITLDQVAAQAADLRIAASFRDDIGDFYDLVRRASAKPRSTERILISGSE